MDRHPSCEPTACLRQLAALPACLPVCLPAGSNTVFSDGCFGSNNDDAVRFMGLVTGAYSVSFRADAFYRGRQIRLGLLLS